MFNNILCGYDGSKNAEEAVRKAAELARVCDAALTIITVYRHHSLLEASLSMVRPQEPGNMDDLMRGYATECAEYGKKVARELGAPKVRAFVKAGHPSRSIIAFAEEHGCDLIVVGTRGLGSVEHYLQGSVSHKISGLARCPVLVV